MEWTKTTQVFVPRLHRWEQDGLWFFLDPDGPHWVVTDGRGAQLLDWLGESLPFATLIERYAAARAVEVPKAWLHVSAFLHDLLRVGFASRQPIARAAYLGRSLYVKPTGLSECWIHTNNSCNLTCAHCLVSSSPSGERGLPTERLLQLIDEASSLGANRFYFTGGEPFVRPDLFALIEHVTKIRGAELIILTNATLFTGRRLEELARCDRMRLKLQVSLDGARPETNDPIRGVGSFAATIDGLRRIAALGFDISLTTAVTATNCEELPALTELAKAVGAKAQHLMWLHKRGRILDDVNGFFPTLEQLIRTVRAAKQRADELGVIVDNYESVKLRVNGQPFVKYDLGNQGFSSLCVYADGHIYPSAAFANHPPLDCGTILDGFSLKEVWLNSPVLRTIRSASVVQKASLRDEPFRFLTGGGDLEHSYFYAGGDFLGEDPYYPLYVMMIKDVMLELARAKQTLVNRRSGFDSPRLIHAMGEGAITCGTTAITLEGDVEIATLHSNCVLAFDVEKPRSLVREFYTKAAEEPQTELCCPGQYDGEDLGHIPREVIERFYGCGSPIALAQPTQGETLVDLGSGAGIDSFIAAKRVGPSGRVYGIDMTDAMLDVANQARDAVARNLGYDVVEFRKGFLEQVPLEDRIADVITSNCVINLSPDKRSVFHEMWRLLKDHGRIVISDIVSDRPVPPRLKVNPQLWGECTVGALTEAEFLAYAEQAGFYGVEVLTKHFYKEIPARPPARPVAQGAGGDDRGAGGEGYPFYSLTLRGYKFEKTAGCTYVGQRAIYHGPFKAVMDEEGHLFWRNEASDVCTDTAAKLSAPPYHSAFTVVSPETPVAEVSRSSGCGPGCC